MSIVLSEYDIDTILKNVYNIHIQKVWYKWILTVLI